MARPAPVPPYGTIVVVGASLAGWRAAQALRQGGHAGRLIVIGAELHAPYDRPPLSKQVLTGKVGVDQIGLGATDDLDVEWHLGVAATGLDLDGRRVLLAGGSSVGFDGLVIATGAHARSIPALADLAGVHLLRTLDDAVAVRAALVREPRVVVIGAGFIGLEVASSARKLGLDVTVVEVASVPLLPAVGPEIGAGIADWHREHGVDVRLGVGLESLVGTTHVEGVRLAGAEPAIPADLVVVGVGAAPNTAWLEGSGVDLDDGVRADDRLRVLAGGQPLPHVVAAGDVVRWDHPELPATARMEHWTNAVELAQVAAATLLGGSVGGEFPPVPYFWSDQFDRKIQMVGRTAPGDELTVVDGSVASRRFVAAYGRRGRLVAAVGFGRPARVMAMQRLIASGAAYPPAL
jgi:3-phenylpropionate/trans-cinnamate dioxygenase ferredoxin reductase subunit